MYFGFYLPCKYHLVTLAKYRYFHSSLMGYSCWLSFTSLIDIPKCTFNQISEYEFRSMV